MREEQASTVAPAKETLDPLRWGIITLVFFATVVNYLDRQTLSVLAPLLLDQFRMSNVAYSRVVFAFMLAFTIMNGVFGALHDRIGVRRGYALSMAWWSAAAVLHAFVRNAWELGVCRFLLGAAEAGNWPAGVKVVTEWFPERERATASGIFNSGSAVAAVISPPLVVWITLHLGWRAAFALVGASGFLWIFFWWRRYYTPPEADAKPLAPRVPLRKLSGNRFVWSFTLSKVFIDPVWYFYVFWFPQYLKRVWQFDMASIGKYAWIPFLVAAFGNLLGGWTAAFLLRLDMSLTVARKTAVTLFAALTAAAIPAVLVGDVRISIAMVSLAMLGYTGSSANMMAFPADVFPKNLVGSVFGFASMGSGFGGMLFSLITGWVIDHYSYAPVFVGFAITPLVAVLILWTLLGPLRRTAEFG
jgi:ACS family hexuronate transporter-like MFS transporter